MAKYKAREIMLWNVMSMDNSGRNVPKRALDHKEDLLWSRIKWAWGVITGRFDVIDWQENGVSEDE